MKSQTLLLAVLAGLIVTPLWAGGHGASYSGMIIRKYDTNDDGKLNADEYPERYQKYFRTTDSNQDGYVDSSELTTQMEKIHSQWRTRMAEKAKEYRERKLRQRVDQAFDGDKNEDGRLNADEALVDIQKSFRDVDANADGYLDRSEIESAFGLTPKATETIVATAASAGSFQTLLKAAVAAGLDKALQGEGPFTVFAPTDDAFAKIPKETLAALLKDKEQLAEVLKYHVVAGNVLAKDVVKLTAAETLQGSSVQISVNSCGVKVDNANVVKTDIRCSNGVIHVIDAVLLPKIDEQTVGKEKANAEKSIVETAISAGSFKTLIKAVQVAGLVDALSGDDDLTVFAPTDAAFAKLPKAVLEEILADKEKLQAILTYHVVAGRVLAKDVVELKAAKTLQGQSVEISVTDEGVKINDANVVKTDITCTNGVIHVIDSVIVPEFTRSASETESELLSFENGEFEKRWVTVNDNVMGGVSKGKVRLTDDDTLEFYGDLSLRNNGGFASVRSSSRTLNLEDGDTLVARVRGDGREYYLNLYAPSFRMAFSYRTPIQTEAGKWTEVRVPLSDFYATSFGRRVRNAQLDPSKVNSLGFLLSDKKAGPFRLEVESIRVAK
jgi:transforming growth factor-beta-induced protein